MWRFKENEDDDEDITHGCCWLYTPRIKNIKKKKRFWVGKTLSKQKILTRARLFSTPVSIC
jgi:hypothetical protein